MDSSVSLQDEIWFLRVCHHISNAVITYMFKLGLTQQQDRPLYGVKKENRVHIVCQCLVVECERYSYLGRMVLGSKLLENMWVNGIVSLVANTRLGIVL